MTTPNFPADYSTVTDDDRRIEAMRNHGGGLASCHAFADAVRYVQDTLPAPKPAPRVRVSVNDNEYLLVKPAAAEALVRALANDARITIINVGSTRVFTRPVPTCGLDENALRRALLQ
jgi:hypothetical protein